MVTSSMIRQAVVPMAVGYLLIMASLGFGLRRLCRPKAGCSQTASGPAGHRRGPRPATGPGGGWPALARHVVGTAVGGYLLLMGVVVAYYYGVARVGGQFLKSAFTGTAMLIGLALPIFAAASWLAERRHRREGEAAGGGQQPRSPHA